MTDLILRLQCGECKRAISSSQLGASVYVNVHRKLRDGSYHTHRCGPFHAKCGEVFNERARAGQGKEASNVK